MTEHDRERVEALLRRRTEELQRTRKAVKRDTEGMLDAELSRLDNHPADQGTELHEQEVDLTTDVFFEEEMRRIAEARRALADGSYGTCQSCGAAIPPERLSAVPEAVRCVECQREFEARHRQSGAG